MPGRKFSTGSSYRFGFNGQEKSLEINGADNFTTAEFWEYDSRIGRRWNVDPVTKESKSPYSCFSDNPILNNDPYGDSDSTYKTPGGGSITTETSTAQTFDGSKTKVGNLTVQPPKGTLKSFVATDEGFEGGSARYVATFDTKTGAFKGYGWDKDLTSTYDDYLKAKGEDIVKNGEHANDPMWDPNISHAQGAKNAVNLGLTLILPTPLTKGVNIVNKLSAANNAVKQGFKIEGQLVKIWSERKLFVNWLKGNCSAGGTTLNLTQAKQVIENARKLGIAKIDLNRAGQLGEEITGATAGIRHFKIENIHIYIKEFNELLK